MDFGLTPFPLKFLTLQNEHLALHPLLDKTAEPLEFWGLQYLNVPISPNSVSLEMFILS